LSMTVAILAKGRCFLDLRLKSLHPCRNMNLSFQQINIVRGYCWGPSAFEGPQKHEQCFPSEICEQVSSESGYGYTNVWSRRSLSGTEGDHDEG
jgi:hypothetical protein